MIGCDRDGVIFEISDVSAAAACCSAEDGEISSTVTFFGV